MILLGLQCQHEKESFQRNADRALAPSDALVQRSQVSADLVRVLSQGSLLQPRRGASLSANAKIIESKFRSQQPHDDRPR